MKINPAGLDIIKECEGLRLAPYLCPADVATIGYGHVIIYEGRQLTGRMGLARARVLYPEGITAERAEELLQRDVARFEREVAQLVTVPLTENQFSALVSFHFNTGKLGSSTLLKKLNAGDIAGAANEFKRWVFAGKKTLPGLVKRRAAERALFLKA